MQFLMHPTDAWGTETGRLTMTQSVVGGVQPDIMFVDEVAEYLRRSVDSVRWLINSKQIKAAKLGGRVVVRRSDLEKFVSDAFGDDEAA